MLNKLIELFRRVFGIKTKRSGWYLAREWAKYNTPDSETALMKRQSSKYFKRPLVLTDPDGNEYYITKCFYHFCRQNGLEPGNLRKVAQGKRNHHKHWTARYATPK